jgi:hypothetical protein
MQQLGNALKKVAELWPTLLDHYTLLSIDPASSADEIEAAFRCAMRKRNTGYWSRAGSFLCGRTQSNLVQARRELLDPTARANYDKHLHELRKFFQNPPQ